MLFITLLHILDVASVIVTIYSIAYSHSKLSIYLTPLSVSSIIIDSLWDDQTLALPSPVSTPVVILRIHLYPTLFLVWRGCYLSYFSTCILFPSSSYKTEVYSGLLLPMYSWLICFSGSRVLSIPELVALHVLLTLQSLIIPDSLDHFSLFRLYDYMHRIVV